MSANLKMQLHSSKVNQYLFRGCTPMQRNRRLGFAQCLVFFATTPFCGGFKEKLTGSHFSLSVGGGGGACCDICFLRPTHCLPFLWVARRGEPSKLLVFLWFPFRTTPKYGNLQGTHQNRGFGWWCPFKTTQKKGYPQQKAHPFGGQGVMAWSVGIQKPAEVL